MEENRNADDNQQPENDTANEPDGTIERIEPTAVDNNENADEPEQQQQQEQQRRQHNFSWSGALKGFAIRLAIVYFVSSLFRRSPQPQPTGDGSLPSNVMHPSSNLFMPNQLMDMLVYINEEPVLKSFKQSDLYWHLEEIIYGDWEGGPTGDSTYVKDVQLPLTSTMQNNGSIYMHILFVKNGHSANPALKSFSRTAVVSKTKLLNRFKRLQKKKLVKNLLTGKSDDPEVEAVKAKAAVDVTESSKPMPIRSHWHPNLTVNIVSDHTPWTRGSVPPPLDEFVEFETTTGGYYPIVYLNDYWNLNRDYQPINETVSQLNLTLTFYPISLFKWQMFAAQGMRNKWLTQLGMSAEETEDDDEQDTIKMAMLETNPYLLGITFVVSIVHSIFDLLAFKNDIQFWRSRESLEGLSVRSVFFNVFQSVVVLLYVLDNDTNLMVRVSVFIGLLIEIWKVFKVVTVTVDRERKWLNLIPVVTVSHKSSYRESPTKKYDEMAFRYLGWVLFPLLIGYAIYSIIYLEHKGWYSWVLSMLYGFLLMFGFILMTPQLFINYKLKSVAHLPWRMLTYKALNTFIDDLFAFVIQMPTLYRIGCFRDDVVFLIFMYQRYIYRVDPTRLNEYGTSQEMYNTSRQQPQQQQPAVQDVTDESKKDK